MKETDKAKVVKKNIIDVIVTLMDEEGLKNVSIQQICKASGIAVGTFYHYFESKENVIFEIIRQMDNHFSDNKEIFETNKDELKNLRVFINEYIKYILEWGYYCNKTIIMNSLNYDSKLVNKNRNINIILNSIAERMIKKGQCLKGLTSNQIESMVLIFLRGFGFEWAKSINKEFPIEIFEKQVEMFVESLKK